MGAVRVARAIITAPAMTPFQVSEVAPGADRASALAWDRKDRDVS